MAIFRGTGGAGDSTDDSIVSEVTEQAGIATTKAQEAATSATNASNSASSASSSETAASNSATAAAGSASTATTKASEAASHASDALASKNAAATSATAAADSATAANSANVQTVAGLSTEITNLNGIRTDITGVNAVRADVVTVSGISSDVTTVAADASDIGTVATNITNVNNVGDNISNVNAVHSNASNINTVAADGSDIGTVAGNISNVNTVAGISSDVTTVAGLESKMDAVIADASDIGAVAGNIGNVNTVAGDSSDINTVAGISADVTSVADNMTDVQNADTNAANAATSASNASDSASAASTSASSASSSASSASTSATNAGNSATAASNSATAASGSASAASGSASAASGSASAAASSASAASTSASNAATSETNAASSASAAATSATNAATSETNAAASATDSSNAASTWSNYYNTYVGASSSAPTVDVQGNALVAGALYFNTTNNTTYVWTGSAWNAVANNNIINPNVALTQDLATNGNDINFGDNDKATFGASDDLEIYHNGSASYIEEKGTGSLYIKGTQLRMQATDGTTYLEANDGGAVTLKHSGTTVFNTTSTGIDVTGTVTNLNESGGSVLNFQQGGSGKAWIANRSYGFHNGSGLAINTTDANPIRFGTNNTEKVRIDSSGNVGIGTSSPSVPLHVTQESNAISGTNVDVSNLGLKIINPQNDNNEAVGMGFALSTVSSNIGAAIIHQRDDSQSRGSLSFATKPALGEGADIPIRMTIDSDGRVGIGTSSPAYTLDVASSTDAVVRILGDKDNASGEAGKAQLYLANDGGANGFFLLNENVGGSAGALSFGVRSNNSDTEAMRIDSSGNVGIGTSSPTSLVHLSGTYPKITLNDETGVDRAFSVGTNNETFTIRNETGSANALTITNANNVGIGTSSPATTLEVKSNSTNDFITLQHTSGPKSYIGNSSVGSLVLSADEGNSGNTSRIEMKVDGTERMRIDSSGNLLVGKTSDSINTVGGQLNADGLLVATRDGGNTAVFNRKTSDGAVVQFRKDGTTVGSIGNNGNGLYINSVATGYLSHNGTRMFNWDSSQFYPQTNGAKDLGHSSYRWRDAYLSGGVYLGGTGAANKLDDYEEGTWTPIDSSGAGLTLTASETNYVKIGRQVTVSWKITYPSTSDSSGMRIGGLPFAPDSSFVYGGSQSYTTSSEAAACTVTNNASTIIYRTAGGSTQINNSQLSAKIVRGSFTYFTDS